MSIRWLIKASAYRNPYEEHLTREEQSDLSMARRQKDKFEREIAEIWEVVEAEDRGLNDGEARRIDSLQSQVNIYRNQAVRILDLARSRISIMNESESERRQRAESWIHNAVYGDPDEQHLDPDDKDHAVFGLTEDPNSAGYILPDGGMLNFSGGEDHRAISGISDDLPPYTEGMILFCVVTGAVRIRVHGGTSVKVNVYQPPTQAQVQRIAQICKNCEYFAIDVSNEEGQPYWSREVNYPTVGGVMGMLEEAGQTLGENQR